jgi:hypothetical protein
VLLLVLTDPGTREQTTFIVGIVYVLGPFVDNVTD